MFLMLVIAILFAVYTISKIRSLEDNNKALQTMIQNHITKDHSDRAVSSNEETVTYAGTIAKKSSPMATMATPNYPKKVDSPILESPTQPNKQQSKGGFIRWLLNSTLAKTIERTFSENWTGFIGTILLILGVGFLSVYTALKMAPVYRFLMICAVSAGLAAGSFYFKKKDFWKLLNQWTKSAAAGLFLFACVGAGGIPTIKWIHSLHLALFVLLVGIVVNLVTGFLSRKEFFVSIHTFFGLLALSIGLPVVYKTELFSVIFLGISALIAIASIVWGRNEQWEYNTLISVSSFSLFHLFWAMLIGFNAFTPIQQTVGIATILAVCVTALFVHYSKLYTTKTFHSKPFWVHVLCWYWLGVGLLQHYAQSPWATVGISFGAIVALFIAGQAKKLAIRWLYLTDSLIAQGLGVMAVCSFLQIGASYSLILNLIFCLLTLFLVVRIIEKETHLSRITDSALLLSGIANLYFHIPIVSISYTQNIGWSATFFIGSTIIGAAAHFFLLKKTDAHSQHLIPFLGKNTSVFGILLGLALSVIYLLFNNLEISPIYLLLVASSAIFIRQKMQCNGFGLGLRTSIAFISLHQWLDLLIHSFDIQHTLLRIFVLGTILIGTAFFSYKKNTNRYHSSYGIYLFGIHLLISIYLIGKLYMALAIGTVFLLTSVILLELSRITQKKLKHSGAYILHVAYVFVAAFIFWHLSKELSIDMLLGIFEVTVLIQLVAIFVFIYWFFSRTYRQDVPDFTWTTIHPLFIELTLLFITMLAYSHIPGNIRSLYWIALAFFALYFGSNQLLNVPRLRTYAYGFYIVSTFQMSFVASRFMSPSLKLFDQTWMRSLFAIFGQVGFLGYALKSLNLNNIEYPKSLQWAQKISDTINKNKVRFLFYPLFLFVALFLYWSFDKSILTLLWLLEALVLFLLSIFLSNNHFRLISMGAVSLCLLRIIFYDLTSASTITRAIVFIGSGVILILMNSTYNKCKDRFKA
jgi:hypothetical protein